MLERFLLTDQVVVITGAGKGGSQSKPLLDTTVEALQHSFHFNVLSPFELVRRSVPHMLERGAAASSTSARSPAATPPAARSPTR